MKEKIRLFLFLLLIGTGISEVNAQSMVIRAKDGTETVKSLSGLQKFTFNDNNLLLDYTTGSTESYSLSNISKLYFSTGNGNSVITSQTNKISIYPNPTSGQLYVSNIPESSTIATIYRIDGALVLKTEMEAGTNTISVEGLSKGLYLLKINNQVLKFFKQ
jgi:hypothetical protein